MMGVSRTISHAVERSGHLSGSTRENPNIEIKKTIIHRVPQKKPIRRAHRKHHTARNGATSTRATATSDEEEESEGEETAASGDQARVSTTSESDAVSDESEYSQDESDSTAKTPRRKTVPTVFTQSEEAEEPHDERILSDTTQKKKKGSRKSRVKTEASRIKKDIETGVEKIESGVKKGVRAVEDDIRRATREIYREAEEATIRVSF